MGTVTVIFLLIGIAGTIIALKDNNVGMVLCSTSLLFIVYMMDTFQTPKGESTKLFKKYTCVVR